LTVVGPTVRWLHLGACVGLVGIAAFLLLAGRSDLAGARAWVLRMLAWARALVIIAIAGGVLTLAHQTAVLEGRLDAALDPAALGRVLFQTQLGVVWLARHALLLLLAAFLVARLEASRPADWIATRTQLLLLGALALGLLAASGHSAAVEPGTAQAIGIATMHLFATGIWVGGLPALAALLQAATRDGTPDMRAYAARTSRRFSDAAFASVLVLIGTGIGNALSHVASVPALVGTPYGQLLLLKIALLVPILCLAAIARRRLLPALATGWTALGRLRRFALAEAGLAALILLLVAVLGLTKPGRHDQPTWPFAFRWVSPTEVVQAHPTTYVRPSVPYTTASIVSGGMLYKEHCAGCHGARRAPLAREHTAGDLFWWITHGVEGSKMPAYGKRLSPEHRWDLVNFMRTLEAEQASKLIGPKAEPEHPRLVAPDFTYAVGPIPPQALRDFRGSKMVYLVLYTLPDSRPRMRDLASAIDALFHQNVEIIAVPTDGAADAIRRLGAERGLYFAVVTDGARDIVPVYGQLAGGAPHAEFLIDRQGYVRTRWAGAVAEAPSIELLLQEVQRLEMEQPATPPAEEHIH
jgi:putative copper resistance protein D